jgi:hypothetical protein
MRKFLCLQCGPAEQGKPPAAADMEAMYAAFQRWTDQYRSNLVDPGGRLRRGKSVRGNAIKDGPFAESKEVVGGYMILSAESLEQAIEIARACPGLVTDHSGFEVREIITS